MSSQRLLIRNGFVVSMDPDVGEVPFGEVYIEDGRSRRSVESSAFRMPRRSTRPA